MDGINKKYNIEIEVLTPLSIGVGSEKDWVRGIDFVVDKGNLYKLNLKKIVAAGIKSEELSSYFATKNEDGLKQKLAGNLASVSDICIPMPTQSDNDIKSFVKNQLSGNPVLTGSSLKGSIRSILFQYLGGNNSTGKEVFGSSKEGDEFMRFIKLSDAEFDETSLVNTKIFNLRGSGNNWQGGWKHQMTNREGNSFTDGTFKQTGFNTIYECIMPTKKSNATLMLSASIYDKFEEEKRRQHIKTEKKRPILHNDISFLFGIINKHTRDYLQKEKTFFQKYPTDRTNDIISSIDSLLSQISADNSCCLLKMSAGSGFHSITGDWQFDDYSQTGTWTQGRNAGKKKYKSRKIAVWDDNLSLMGFVKLRAMSNDEVKQLEENRKVEMLRKEQERQAEAEAKRVKAETEAKMQREKEERKRLYDARIAEVRRYIDAELYEKAWATYQNACSEFPDAKQNSIDTNWLETKVKSIQLEKAIEQSKQAEEEKRRQANAIPLAEKIANVQKIPTLCGNVKTWMKLNGVESLSEDHLKTIFEKIGDIVSQMKPKDRGKLKSFGNELDSLVGSDIASNWFKEIVNP